MMSVVKNYRRNIGLNYLYTSVSSVNFTHGLWMVYLALRGFSLLELGLLEGIYHVTSLLMEVPTGVVADLWGRKTSRIAGRCTAVSALAIMFFSQSFLLQAIAFIATALGNNLESGAGDALVYDSLVMDSQEDRYMHVAGRQELVYQLTAIVTFAVGGLIALRSYGLLFGLSMVFAVIAAIIAIGFREPPVGHPKRERVAGGILKRIGVSMRDQVMESLAIVKSRRRIVFFIAFSELLFCFMTVLFFYLQNYWISLGFTEFHIGIIFSANAIVAGLTAWRAPQIERAIGERGVLTAMPVLVLFCLWGVVVGPSGTLFYILVGFVEGMLITAIGTYLNRLIPSTQRATILSFQSMVFSLFMIILFPLVGLLADKVSIASGFLFMASLATILVGVYGMVIRPWKSDDPESP